MEWTYNISDERGGRGVKTVITKPNHADYTLVTGGQHQQNKRVSRNTAIATRGHQPRCLQFGETGHLWDICHHTRPARFFNCGTLGHKLKECNASVSDENSIAVTAKSPCFHSQTDKNKCDTKYRDLDSCSHGCQEIENLQQNCKQIAELESLVLKDISTLVL